MINEGVVPAAPCDVLCTGTMGESEFSDATCDIKRAEDEDDDDTDMDAAVSDAEVVT